MCRTQLDWICLFVHSKLCTSFTFVSGRERRTLRLGSAGRGGWTRRGWRHVAPGVLLLFNCRDEDLLQNRGFQRPGRQELIAPLLPLGLRQARQVHQFRVRGLVSQPHRRRQQLGGPNLCCLFDAVTTRGTAQLTHWMHRKL